MCAKLVMPQMVIDVVHVSEQALSANYLQLACDPLTEPEDAHFLRFLAQGVPFRL